VLLELTLYFTLCRMWWWRGPDWSQ